VKKGDLTNLGQKAVEAEGRKGGFSVVWIRRALSLVPYLGCWKTGLNNADVRCLDDLHFFSNIES